jgi:hypothetical protein
LRKLSQEGPSGLWRASAVRRWSRGRLLLLRRAVTATIILLSLVVRLLQGRRAVLIIREWWSAHLHWLLVVVSVLGVLVQHLLSPIGLRGILLILVSVVSLLLWTSALRIPLSGSRFR